MNVMKRKLSILLLALLVFVVSIVPVLASHDNITYSGPMSRFSTS